MAKLQNITIDQGATWRLSLRYYTLTSGVKTPVDLTVEGYAVKMQIRRSYADAKVLCQIDSETTGGIALGDEGQVDMAISPALSSLIPPGAAVYDITITKPDGSISRWLEGAVDVRPSVTR